MTVLLVLAALACLTGEVLNLPSVVYAAKPIATLAIFAIAARTIDPITPAYRTLISAGLICSLAGDILLMMPEDRFVWGLLCFLVAHLFYIRAFATTGGGLRGMTVGVVIAAIAALMISLLWTGLGEMRVPVLLYIAVIATMAWQAMARWQDGRGEAAGFAAAGAVAFLVSDGALAIRRFKVEYPFASVVVLGTYWLAQWCIARSVAKVPARERLHPIPVVGT